jgi:hypothetical protein
MRLSVVAARRSGAGVIVPGAVVVATSVVAAAIAVVDAVGADEQVAAAGVAAVEGLGQAGHRVAGDEPETTPGVTADAEPPS